MLQACFSWCIPFAILTQEELLVVDKALGNIRKSHKSITFTGLVNYVRNKASMVHFLAHPNFAYAQALEAAMMGKD